MNHTWLAVESEAVAAAVALARRLGLETEQVVDALDGGPLVSPWQAAKLQRIAVGEFSPQFALSLALKNLRLAPSRRPATIGSRLSRALPTNGNRWSIAGSAARASP